MPTPIRNSFYRALRYQETPTAYFRLGEMPGYGQTVKPLATAYWRLGEASGLSLADATGNGHTVTLPSAVGITYNVASPLADGSTGLAVDGTQGEATFTPFSPVFLAGAAPATAAAGTIELWITPSAIPPSQGSTILVDSAAFDGAGLWLEGTTTTNLHLKWYDSGHANTTPLRVGTLYHVALVFNGAGTATWYINGVADGTFTMGDYAFPLGALLNYFDTQFYPVYADLLDEIAVYVGLALSAAQVAEHYALRTSTISGVAAPTIYDAGPNAINGSLVVTRPGPTQLQAGYPSDGDYSILMDGASYVRVPTTTALNLTGPMTLVAAVKFTSTTGYGFIISKSNGGADGYELFRDTGTGKIRFSGGTGAPIFDLTSPLGYADGNYHLITAVYDPIVSQKAFLYIDGVLVVSSGTLTTLIPASSADLIIGARGNAGTVPFIGTIDEVALYAYALRQSQITAIVNARTVTTGTRALMQARAGLARSGAARSNYYTSRLIVLLGGVDVSNKVIKKSLGATDILNEQPDTASLILYDKTGTLSPANGQTLVLADGAENNPFFGGVLVRTKRQSVKVPGGTNASVALYGLDATDWTFLFNRRLVTKRYAAGTLAHVIVLDIISSFTTGFTSNNVQVTSPAISGPVTLKATSPTSAIAEVCQRITPNWHFYIDPNKDVHFFLTETTQNPVPIGPGVYSYDNLNYTLDLTQIRTRILAEGGGGSATAPVAVSSTSIPVDECGWYLGGGGSLILNDGQIVTYTGRSATSGPGNLTGVPAGGAGSITAAIRQGDQIHVYVITNDTVAQGVLALLEGGDGIHEKYITDGNWTTVQCTDASNGELAAYSASNISGTLISRDRFMRSGKTLAINLPARGLVNISVTIQQVTRRMLNPATYEFDVSFATTWQNLLSVLKRLSEAS